MNGMVIGATYSLAEIMKGSFFLLLLVFTIHALFVGYHWFTFGDSRRTSTVALAIYLGGGAFLFLTLATSLYLI